MGQIDWELRGPEIVACNCELGCPCQFNSLPTGGSCQAVGAMEIVTGHYGGLRLDGLRWARVAAWPGPIHLGNGEMEAVIDANASTEQREALTRILSGEDSEPGTTFFQVFNAMASTHHPIRISPIDFSVDWTTLKGHVRVPGLLDLTTDAIRNPVTGKPQRARVILDPSFEFSEAEFASGTFETTGAIRISGTARHAHLTMLHIGNNGVVR
jgi:hypothetical protein